MRYFSASRYRSDHPNRRRALWIGIPDFARQCWPILKVAGEVLSWLRKLAGD